MHPLMWLMLLNVCMFLGSFFAGMLPLSMPLHGSGIRLLSTFGAGLLVGTALVVILPEGVEALYDIKQAVDHRNSTTDTPSGSGLQPVKIPPESGKIKRP